MLYNTHSGNQKPIKYNLILVSKYAICHVKHFIGATKSQNQNVMYNIPG